jgi:hypothetical protein
MPPAQTRPIVGNPARGTPPRRPGSVRRTTTHDSLRPDGLLGPLHLDARGRDLVTSVDGRIIPVAQATVRAQISYIENRKIQALSVDPLMDRTDDLIGLHASSGFRKAVDELLPDEDRVGSLRYQLLDDLPTALLVAGYAMGAGGLRAPRGMMNLGTKADICAGWATGGTILREVESAGHPETVAGPVAAAFADTSDSDGWHNHGALGPHAMRRARRIDVWPDGDQFRVETFFRDSHVDADGRETIVHEYSVTGSVDRETGLFTRSEAGIGVLPYPECPAAVASASRVVGTPARDLRERVRETFVGTSTCTHLNDTLRSLACVPHLISALNA